MIQGSKAVVLLDPPRVTNGTRCVITKLPANTTEANISHDKYAGHDHIIHHIHQCLLTQPCLLNLDDFSF